MLPFLSKRMTHGVSLQDWSYYMSEFGKESWHRVNLAYRYHVGAVFSVAALHADVKFWEVS